MSESRECTSVAAVETSTIKERDFCACVVVSPMSIRQQSSRSVKKTKKGTKKNSGFQSLSLSKPVFGGLMRIGFRNPTPIQRKMIPVALAGGDVVAMARTGSGKTAAFVIPLLERLKAHRLTSGVRALVLAPTRELAIQSLKFTTKLAKFTDLRAALIVGGESLNAQFSALAANPDIIVATPGRLCHLLKEVKDFKLKAVEVLVLDEADRLFEMGFAEQIGEIMDACRSEMRQTMLVSATLPKVLAEFTYAGLKDPTFVRLDEEHRISPTLRLGFFSTRKAEKPAALLHLVREVIRPECDQTIIFVATRHHAQFVHLLLKEMNIESLAVFGNMDMTARKRAISMFRKRKVNLLVVTDVAARGLDVPLLKNVINYDFPAKPKLFVHRAGRAGRQGRVGTVFSITSPDELPYMIDLYLFLGRPIRGCISAKEDVDVKNADVEQNRRRTEYDLASMTTEDVDYGIIPRRDMDSSMETFQSILSSNYEIGQQYKVSNNAYKAYIRSRPPASRLSFLRAKDLDMHVVHPLFVRSKGTSVIGEETGGSADNDGNVTTLTKISNYRPSLTVIEVASLKSGKGPSLTMREKRKRHRGVIESTRNSRVRRETNAAANGTMSLEPHLSSNTTTTTTAKTTKRRLSKAERRRRRRGDSSMTSSAPPPSSSSSSFVRPKASSDFRDNTYYISTGPKSRSDVVAESAMTVSGCIDQSRRRIDDSTLDVQGDESGRAARDKQRRMLWDSKRGRYVKTSSKELRESRAMSKRHRLDKISGRVSKKKEFGKLYDKWSKRSKRRVGAIGETENVSTRDVDAMKELVLPHTRRTRHDVAHSGSTNELVSATVLRKRRKEKERRTKRAAGGTKKSKRKRRR